MTLKQPDSQESFAHIRLGDAVSPLYRPEMRSTTAHASAEGYVLVTNSISDEGSRCELAVISRYNGNSSVLRGVQVTSCLRDLSEEEEEESSDYDSFRAAAKALGNFRAFGTESNFSELAAEKINYNIRAEEVDWSIEVLDLGDGRKFRVPAELRGFNEVDNPNGIKGELLEPITCEEALGFISDILDHDDISLTEGKASISCWVEPMLELAIEVVEDLKERLSEEDFADFMCNTSEEKYRRVKASVGSKDGTESGNIDGDWTYQSTYSIGERNGITTDQSRQNDVRYTKFEQYHQLFERVDGKFLYAQELEQAERTNLFSQLFGGFYLDWNDLDSEGEPKSKPRLGPDKYKPKHGRGRCPKVRSWADQRLYLRRRSQDRDETFAKALWQVLTWPMELLEEAMPRLRTKYKASVRVCSPGPDREFIGGRWKGAPLKGTEALAHLRANPGTITSRVKVSVLKTTVAIGHTWHKLFLTKAHMDELEATYLWRQGKVTLSIGEKLVKEEFQQEYQGLPTQYVKETYGSKKLTFQTADPKVDSLADTLPRAIAGGVGSGALFPTLSLPACKPARSSEGVGVG